MPRLLPALCLVLLLGCDSAEDDLQLAIPVTPEESTDSFRIQGARTDLGTGFGEDVIVLGRGTTLAGPDNVPLFILDCTREGSENAFHFLLIEFLGLPSTP